MPPIMAGQTLERTEAETQVGRAQSAAAGLA